MAETDDVHDPLIRFEIKELILDNLYKSEEAFQQEQLAALIDVNSELAGNQQPFFTFKGKTYCKDLAKPLDRSSKGVVYVNALHKSLRDQMKSWLKDQEEIADERASVIRYLQAMFSATMHAEDFLRVLPPSLHQTIQHYKSSFDDGVGTLQGEALKEFQQNNAKGLAAIKNRMAMGLLI